MSDERRQRNTPPHTLRPGRRSRHELLGIAASSRPDRMNSIALPGIDTAAEVELINQGYAERLPGNRYQINGRIYVDKGDGYTFPVSGVEVRVITNPQFRSLRLLIRHDGRTVAFDRATARDPTISETDITVALELFRLRKGA